MTTDNHILSSSEEIGMLRESARSFLAQEWPPEKAPAASKDPAALRALWSKMGRQGWLALGAGDTGGELRFAAVLLEELGRAGCPAPMVDAYLANRILASALPGQDAAEALLAALHRGDAVVSVVLGAHDGDVNAGAPQWAQEARAALLYGQSAFIEGSSVATHFLVLTDQFGEAAVVVAGATGLQVTATPGFIAPSLAEVRFDKTPATAIRFAAPAKGDFGRLARLCLTSRSLGAATRGFEMVVDYAKERTQFGRKIGQFQAIQHKLANVLINVEISKLALLRALATHDRGDAGWRYAAGAAVSVASPALRQACLETHHAFGGVSFWEEHEMPRHFRRIHADLVRCGGVHGAREDVAHALLDAA